jgi:hypothetical protein
MRPRIINSMATLWRLFRIFHSTQKFVINYNLIFTQFADLYLCLMSTGGLQFPSVLSRFWVTLNWVLDWILDLLTTFNTQIIIALNYNAIADVHILQIPRAHAKFFPACSEFTSSCLLTVSNNYYSSASVLSFFLNGGSLPASVFLLYGPP